VASNRVVRHTIVALVLFLMALPVEASAMWAAMRRPLAPGLAIAVNFGLLPLFAWGIAIGLGLLPPPLSQSREMVLGILVAATVPSTLASAAVWTRRAGGNDSVAIMVTILTNLSCFLVTPMWLYVMTGQWAGESEALDLGPMIWTLLSLVVLPMTIAQLLRFSARIRSWASAKKIPIGVLAQLGVLSMVTMGSIQSGMQLREAARGQLVLLEVATMIAAVLTVHVVMLYAGIVMARHLRLGRADQIAVGFAGSQKTLMVGLQIAMELGLSVLPMLTYHVGQLLIDTFIADRFREKASVESSNHQNQLDPRDDSCDQPAT
jgi:sodium/bile acid cotransporter 7